MVMMKVLLRNVCILCATFMVVGCSYFDTSESVDVGGAPAHRVDLTQGGGSGEGYGGEDSAYTVPAYAQSVQKGTDGRVEVYPVDGGDPVMQMYGAGVPQSAGAAVELSPASQDFQGQDFQTQSFESAPLVGGDVPPAYLPMQGVVAQDPNVQVFPFDGASAGHYLPAGAGGVADDVYAQGVSGQPPASAPVAPVFAEATPGAAPISIYDVPDGLNVGVGSDVVEVQQPLYASSASDTGSDLSAEDLNEAVTIFSSPDAFAEPVKVEDVDGVEVAPEFYGGFGNGMPSKTVVDQGGDVAQAIQSSQGAQKPVNAVHEAEMLMAAAAEEATDVLMQEQALSQAQAQQEQMQNKVNMQPKSSQASSGGAAASATPQAPEGQGYFTPVSMETDGRRVAVIYFDHNSTVLDAGDRAVIAEARQLFDAGRDVGISVEGHSSVRANYKNARQRKMVNLNVSMRRAYHVVKALVALGVPAEVIRTVAWGEVRPPEPVQGMNDEAAARRVEIIIQ
jgi:outer membrane protein OmpA-like peptidoglycan-associated protein